MKKLFLYLYFVILPLFFTSGLLAQFETLETPANSIVQIRCFDELCVFLDGKGPLLKSYDIGETYVALTAPASTGMYEMACIDSSIYFIAASSSPLSPTANIFKTIDGGQTWTTLLDTVATYWAFDMANEQKGILVGGITGNILQTNDGWETTTFQSTGPPSVYYVRVHFVDSNLIILGKINTIMRSNDGGTTWSAVHGFADRIPSDIYHFSDSLLFVTANFNSRKSQIIRSRDGGVTWEKVFEEWDDKLYDILFVSENEGYVCGYNVIQKHGVLLYTYDGGDTWNKLSYEQDKKLGVIEQANDSILLIGGEGGLLLRFNRNQITTGSQEAIQEEARLWVNPNPVTETLTVNMQLPASSRINFELYNSQGSRLLSHFTGETSPGLTEVVLDVSGLPAGYYILKATTAHAAKAVAVVKN